jgi:hypothetical protein
MSVFRRKVLAWLGVGSLLFLQLVVSGYACNMASFTDPKTASTAAQESSMPCDGSMDAPSKVCEQHCLQGAQSIDTQHHATPLTPVLGVIGVVGPSDVRLHALSKVHHSRLVRQVDPPPLVRFGALRI